MPAPTPNAQNHAPLQGLLTDALQWDAEYGRGMSNHLPMALVALHALGADDDLLKRYSTRYAAAKALRPARPAGGWQAGDAWPRHLGRRGAWPRYRDLFRQWLADEGIGDVLPQVLPALMRGCAGAAFHGLIRTAYGVAAWHADEVADGLAHWAAFHLPLGAMPTEVDGRQVNADPTVLLRRLQAHASKAPSIAGRMAAAAEDGRVNTVAACLEVSDTLPEQLARAAALAYGATGNFTALHLVTATHAMRELATRVEEPAVAWAWFWQAYAHGVVAAALVPEPDPVAPLAWGDIVPLAVAQDDEHVIKLVHSCQAEARAYAAGGDDSLWRRAATRAVAT